MVNRTLPESLQSVDWNSICNSFCEDDDTIKRIHSSSKKFAHWAKACQDLNDNAALPFIREVQSSIYGFICCAAVGLSKNAIISCRSMVESGLYYSYFWSHEVELSTLLRDSKYFLNKNDIFSFHNQHTVGFKEKVEKLGLKSSINDWYSEVSANAHSQIPGNLSMKSVSDVAFNKKNVDDLVNIFERGCYNLNLFFLVTIAPELWSGIQVPSRKVILKGITGDTKEILDLH